MLHGPLRGLTTSFFRYSVAFRFRVRSASEPRIRHWPNAWFPRDGPLRDPLCHPHISSALRGT